MRRVPMMMTMILGHQEWDAQSGGHQDPGSLAACALCKLGRKKGFSHTLLVMLAVLVLTDADYEISCAAAALGT